MRGAMAHLSLTRNFFKDVKSLGTTVLKGTDNVPPLSDRNAGDVQFHRAPGRRVSRLKCRPRPPANLAIGRSARRTPRTGVPYVRDPAVISSGSPRRPTPEKQNSTSTTGRNGTAITTEEHIMRG